MPNLDYALRVSRRARRARLIVSADGALTVVIPERFARGRVPEIVERNRGWVERARRRLQLDAPLEAAPKAGRPASLELRALDESWQIEYRQRSSAPRVSERSGRIVVSAPDASEETSRLLLQRYLHRRARAELAPRLLAMAEREQVSVAKVAIRAQCTRWASCSASGTISLNRNLLFLPSALVEYVFAHELCHRHELNHSERFWALLDAAMPSSAVLRRELKSAGRLVPEWFAP